MSKNYNSHSDIWLIKPSGYDSACREVSETLVLYQAVPSVVLCEKNRASWAWSVCANHCERLCLAAPRWDPVPLQRSFLMDTESVHVSFPWLLGVAREWGAWAPGAQWGLESNG